jgi:Sigma-70, region 4
VRKSSGRALPTAEPLAAEADELAFTDDRAERYERLRIGAEAMSSLKPQEIRCLLLRAEGLSYQEICEVTGFSYTNVKRSVSPGEPVGWSADAGYTLHCDLLGVGFGRRNSGGPRVTVAHFIGSLAVGLSAVADQEGTNLTAGGWSSDSWLSRR